METRVVLLAAQGRGLGSINDCSYPAVAKGLFKNFHHIFTGYECQI